VQGEGGLLEVAASSGATEDVTATVTRLDDQIRAAAASGELVAVSTGSGRATIIVPIHTELAPAGVLLLDHHPQTWAPLRDLERDLLGAFADHLGLTLDRAQAMRERHELLVAKDRDRIARDLHDLVIQRLFATGVQLQSVRNAGDLEALRDRVDEAVTELDTAISDLRATIFELGRGGGRSLHEEVRALIGEYAPVLGFLPALRTSGQVDGALAPAVGDGLLMTLREALSNIARHAQASSTTVELTATSRWFALRVTDDGIGFDPGSVPRGHGLDNAVHRAETLGGHVDLRSAPGEGTRMEWVVPTIG
jgi:signal transduction histidine kinase